MSTLTQIRRELAQARRDLIARQKEELRKFRKKQLEEHDALTLAAREKACALFQARRQAKEEKIRARQEALARAAQEKEAAEKLQAAAEAMKALGFTVELKMERAPKPSTRPLTAWQQLMKRVGSLLETNGVELHPGVKDVRLLAVFCSIINVGYYLHGSDLQDENILALARSWHENGGRAGVDTWENKRAWFARVLGH